MIKERLRNKLEEMKKNSLSNKGFTLVELIVVIVILAILIGVTIGGIYMYVGQSRTATDTNNASAITSTLSTMAADQGVYDLAGSITGATETYTYVWHETVDKDALSFTVGSGSDKDAITDYAKNVLTNGLPKSQTGNGFTLTITLTKGDTSGTATNVSVNCVANKTKVEDAAWTKQ